MINTTKKKEDRAPMRLRQTLRKRKSYRQVLIKIKTKASVPIRMTTYMLQTHFRVMAASERQSVTRAR